MSRNQLAVFVCLFVLAAALPVPDSAGDFPLPAPGLAYGGIPYGSMSGNVAEYFNRLRPSVRDANLARFAPVQQYL